MFHIYDREETIDDLIFDIHFRYSVPISVDSTLRMHPAHIPGLLEKTRFISVRYPKEGALYIPFDENGIDERRLDCYVKDPQDLETYTCFGSVDVTDFAVATVGDIPNYVLEGAHCSTQQELIDELSFVNGCQIKPHDLVSVYFLDHFAPNLETQRILSDYGITLPKGSDGTDAYRAVDL